MGEMKLHPPSPYLLVVILLSGNTSAFRLNRLNKRNLDLETDSDFENSERIVNQVRSDLSRIEPLEDARRLVDEYRLLQQMMETIFDDVDYENTFFSGDY